jgi:hypothetical protein
MLLSVKRIEDLISAPRPSLTIDETTDDFLEKKKIHVTPYLSLEDGKMTLSVFDHSTEDQPMTSVGEMTLDMFSTTVKVTHKQFSQFQEIFDSAIRSKMYIMPYRNVEEATVGFYTLSQSGAALVTISERTYKSNMKKLAKEDKKKKTS